MQTFLKAEWRKLALANYVVDPSLLEKYLPAKTELDLWKDKCYVSLVGFMFLNTRIKGFKIPFHVNFEEVNLRFYVKHQSSSIDWKRGVVFIKEFVPKAALTIVANSIYKEHYQTLPMHHCWDVSDFSWNIEYYWKLNGWNSFKVQADYTSKIINEGSEEEFITEHYWGYTKISPVKTSEYQVEHPRWVIYPTKNYQIDVDFGKLYGEEFSFLKYEKPSSVFLAEGSEIAVRAGSILM